MSKKAQPSASRELDTGHATRGVWLVKVPKYLSEAWMAAGASAEVGVMRVNSQPRRVEVSFSLSEALAQAASQRLGLEVPREHRVVMQDTSRQSLATFSEHNSTGDIQAEGKVTQRADMQPVDSNIYMKLKKHQIKQAEKTKNQATQLERAVTTHKPVGQHKEYAEQKRKEKEQGKKARGDRETVLDLIFNAFQQHQYYNFRDLVHKTSQPPGYLKEILREVCIYNTKAPHRNMWELKPEYRHYKD